MILVDHDIDARVKKEKLIENYDERSLTNIGYDLCAGSFSIPGGTVESVMLEPGESSFVASRENIRLSHDLLALISLKNSRIRQGLRLDAPVYQPGHHTKVFFRLTNVSGDAIYLKSGEKYATILFQQLSSPPDSPYNGAFQEELDFSGLAAYKDIYHGQLQEIEKKHEDIKSMESSIYANVLVILSVFVALFSFLTTNVSLASSSASTKDFFAYNLLLLGCISFLIALLRVFVFPKKHNWYVWVPAVLLLAAAAAAVLLF